MTSSCVALRALFHLSLAKLCAKVGCVAAEKSLHGSQGLSFGAALRRSQDRNSFIPDADYAISRDKQTQARN